MIKLAVSVVFVTALVVIPLHTAVVLYQILKLKKEHRKKGQKK
jgi:hypothetical protein